MTTNTNTNYNIDQQLAIYIPYISYDTANIRNIKNTFKLLNIAIVNNVKFKKIVGGYACYLKMEKWFNNYSVYYLQDMIKNNINGGRIVHDDPYYWILLPYFQDNMNKDINYYSQITQNREVNDNLIYRINQLEEKNNLLENKFNNILSYCYFKDSKYSQQLGGCGAVSNAWKPSQPSVSSKNIKISKPGIRKTKWFTPIIFHNKE